MSEWLHQNVMLVAVAFVVLAVIAILLLVLWITAVVGRRRQYFDRVDTERERLDLEVSLQEQLGKLRIVRELHEVAVHSVSVIISQADGAQFSAPTDPAAAGRSVAVIADSARTVLADLRRVMTIVGDGTADVRLQPRRHEIPDLLNVMREAGLEITFVENGERFDHPLAAELVIFRILQEALSNALEFGGAGTQVKVSITWTGEGMQLLVDDDGVRAQARREGLDPNTVAQQRTYTFQDDLNALTQVVVGPGITEMRERASLFGGVFNAYSVPGVGFSVSAVFPALRYDNGVHGVNLDARATTTADGTE